jgi:hypothetical protein
MSLPLESQKVKNSLSVDVIIVNLYFNFTSQLHLTAFSNPLVDIKMTAEFAFLQ